MLTYQTCAFSISDAAYACTCISIDISHLSLISIQAVFKGTSGLPYHSALCASTDGLGFTIPPPTAFFGCSNNVLVSLIFLNICVTSTPMFSCNPGKVFPAFIVCPHPMHITTNVILEMFIAKYSNHERRNSIAFRVCHFNLYYGSPIESVTFVTS